MIRPVFRMSSTLALAVVLAASALPGESRNVPGGHSSPPSSGSAHSGGGSSAPSGSRHVPTRSTAEANHGGHGHGYYPYYPYYSYYPYYWDWPYGPYWSAGVWWGWPGYWGGYGGWYGYPAGYPEYSGVMPRGPAVVETAVFPQKAEILLDGEPIGNAADFNGRLDVLYLDPGHHSLEFSAPGYMTLEVGLDAREGRHYRLDYELKPGEGKDTRSQAVVESASAAPPQPQAAPSAPAAPSPGMPGERTAPSMRHGFLKVLATPKDAAIYLDGEFLGSGDELSRLHGALPVAAGEHRIEVVRPGYASRTTVVTVEDGPNPAEVRVDLERSGGSTL